MSQTVDPIQSGVKIGEGLWKGHRIKKCSELNTAQFYHQHEYIMVLHEPPNLKEATGHKDFS